MAATMKRSAEEQTGPATSRSIGLQPRTSLSEAGCTSQMRHAYSWTELRSSIRGSPRPDRRLPRDNRIFTIKIPLRGYLSGSMSNTQYFTRAWDLVFQSADICRPTLRRCANRTTTMTHNVTWRLFLAPASVNCRELRTAVSIDLTRR